MALNPLNTEARINLLLNSLRQEGKDEQQLKWQMKQADTIIRLSPFEARGYSLKAKILLAQGKHEEAGKLYEKALEVAPTERSALAYVIEKAVRSGDLNRALNALDILLRRWPDTFAKVAPLLDGLASDPAGAVLLIKLLQHNPPWRWRAIQYLLKKSNGRILVQRLLLNERAQGKSLNASERSALIRAWFYAGDILTAYRNFVLTLNKNERKELGYVFDPNFKLKSDGRPFSWQIGSTSYVEIAYPWFGGGNKSGVAIQFRDAPVRLGNILQKLALLPGRYILKTRVSARSLRAPKGIYWNLYCHGKGGYRVRLPVPEGTYREKQLSTQFDIPPGCKFQTLVLRTDLKAPSWRMRYQGEVIFHEVAIEQLSAGKKQ